MNAYFILNDEHIPIPVDLHEWGRWLEEHQTEKIVKQEDVNGFWVSTVFLGLDHSFASTVPQLFETMVFDRRPGSAHPWSDLDCRRYATWELALEGHREVVEEWQKKKEV